MKSLRLARVALINVHFAIGVRSAWPQAEQALLWFGLSVERVLLLRRLGMGFNKPARACTNRLGNGRCENFIGSNLTQFVRHAPQASIRAVCWPGAKSFAIASLPVDRPRADSGIGGIQLLPSSQSERLTEAPPCFSDSEDASKMRTSSRPRLPSVNGVVPLVYAIQEMLAFGF